MPALADVPNTLKVAFQWAQFSGAQCGSRTFWSYSGGPPTVANLNTMATDVSTAYTSHLAAMASVNLPLQSIVITDLTSPSSARGEWTGSIAGTRSGSLPTPQTATLLDLVIARRYRGGKPRTYLPFGVNADLDADLNGWGASYVTAMDAAWGAFQTAMLALTGVGCTLTSQVNVSYYQGFASVEDPVTKRWRNIPTPRTGPLSPDEITNFSTRVIIGSQRRRRTSTTP